MTAGEGILAGTVALVGPFRNGPREIVQYSVTLTSYRQVIDQLCSKRVEFYKLL